METRVPQVIDALVTRMRATPGFRAPDVAGIGLAPVATTVWDGPEFRTADDFGDGGHLVIGYGGDDPESLTPSATTGMVSSVMAGPVRPRDEVSVITCRAVMDRMDTPKLARDGATAIMVAVASLCRSDPTLGIDASATIGGVIVRAWVTAGTLLQYAENSFTAEWEFTVSVRDRV